MAVGKKGPSLNFQVLTVSLNKSKLKDLTFRNTLKGIHFIGS